MQNYHREELLKHLAASIQDAKEEGGAILLVGAGISVSAGIPPAQQLMKIAIENFPNYFTDEEQRLTQDDLGQLQYNNIMTKLSNVKRKELFKWFIEGNSEKGIEKAKLNFAHIAIAELLKQGYFSRILTVNFDPLLIHACYMVGMYPFPAIYDLGAMGKINAELLHDPSIAYLNGQHVGFVQRNTNEQLKAHQETLSQIVRSTGCEKTWVVAGYSGENDPLMDALSELRPFNNWLYWLEYNKDISSNHSHSFLAEDEECKVVNECDADETFMQIAELLGCSLDFIENPQIEFAEYKERIHFHTAGKKADFYQRALDAHFTALYTSKDAVKKLGSLLIKHIEFVFYCNSSERKEQLESLIDQYSDVHKSIRLEYSELLSFAQLLVSYSNEFSHPDSIGLAKQLLEEAIDKSSIRIEKEEAFYRYKSIHEFNHWLPAEEFKKYLDKKKKMSKASLCHAP